MTLNCMCIFFNTAKGWRSGTVTKHAISRVFLHGLHRTELHSRGCLLVLGTGFEASEIVGAFTECLVTNLVTTLDITPTMAYDVRRKDSPELLDLGRVKKENFHTKRSDFCVLLMHGVLRSRNLSSLRPSTCCKSKTSRHR